LPAAQAGAGGVYHRLASAEGVSGRACRANAGCLPLFQR